MSWLLDLTNTLDTCIVVMVPVDMIVPEGEYTGHCK